MEWREQSAVSSDEAFLEAQRWIEAVTKKKFSGNDFRSSLENGVLFCDLINTIKPGIIKRVNRLPTPIAGLDNLNVFLKACGKLGLKEAQLFHPGDLQDLSTRVTVKDQETSRRLKNVLITIYWLGRRAQGVRLYDGPYLNFKAFEGLLGTALYKALKESSSQKGSNVRDSGFGDSWYSEREGGGGGRHRREDSLDSLDSLGSRPHSISSDTTLKGSSEGCGSDTEADSVFRMAENKDTLSYRRSVSITPKPTGPFNQFLPTKDKATGYVPAPLRKKRADRNEESRRSWANPTYVEDEAPLTRQLQTQQSFDGSKSTSDIAVDSSLIRQARYEELQKHREKQKETEDEWQNDLTKWKSRRRSVNSDIVKKKEEREFIEQVTSGGSDNRRSKTYKEMQEERENKGSNNNSVGGRLKSSLSYLDKDEDDVFDQPVAPRRRTLPPRSSTIDTPYFSSEPPKPSLREADPPAVSSATGRAASWEVKTVDSPAGSDTTTTSTSTSTTIPTPPIRSSLRSSQPPSTVPLRRSPVPEHTSSSSSSSTVKTEKTTTVVSPPSYMQKAPEPRRPLSGTQTEAEAPSSGSLLSKRQPQFSSIMEPKPPGVSRVSASLPRSYQRPDSALLTSVVTPRPFGTTSSRITSLPRASTMDDPHKRINGDVDVSKRSSVPTRYQQFITSEEDVRSQSSSAHSSEDEEEEEEGKTPAKSVPSALNISPVPPQVKSVAPVSPAPAKDTSQEHCEMRISLNQKPNSSRDFGFQSTWDSTGARVTSVQPGSPAEMCRLQTGDEVLTVNRQQVAEMSYTDWKTCMEEALQDGSLVMDIRRHGKNSSLDANVVSPTLDFTSRTSTEKLPSKDAPTHTVIDVASNGVNGGFREQPVTMRNKEAEPLSMKNLKRRSEFFEKGGSETAMPDIPVPPITPSVSRWSWNPEDERKRQEKWQKEQEVLLQEKYKRDQEKLQEEWTKAQQEITESRDQQEPGSVEVDGVPHSPLSPQVYQPTAPSAWEEEERERERQRKEEQERHRQAEERRKREEEERELQRLQEQRERKEREEEEERKSMEEEELRWQKRREEELREEERKRQEAAEQQRRERERALQQQQQQQWAGGSQGFAQPPLSYSDRVKSKSSPQLDEEENTFNKVTGSRAGDKKGQQTGTQAEAERQQILNEMKKKTSLIKDGSWIRQSAADPTANKESDVPPMRRGESLDNLDVSYNSWRSSWTPRTNSFSQNYSRPNSALSGNTYTGGLGAQQRPGSSTLPSSYSMSSLRGGAGNPSSNWPRQSPSPSPSSPSPATSPEPLSDGGGQQQRSRSVSGKKICTLCDTPLGKGAAMIIESLGLCYHLTCFKCIDCKSELGGSEAGAEVRIRNKQLYCNTCYMRFKTGQPTVM